VEEVVSGDAFCALAVAVRVKPVAINTDAANLVSLEHRRIPKDVSLPENEDWLFISYPFLSLLIDLHVIEPIEIAVSALGNLSLVLIADSIKKCGGLRKEKPAVLVNSSS
jgi:hypothetical protein